MTERATTAEMAKMKSIINIKSLVIVLALPTVVSCRAEAKTKENGTQPKYQLWESYNPDGISFQYPTCWKEDLEKSLHSTQSTIIGLTSTENCPPDQKPAVISITIPFGMSGDGLVHSKKIEQEKGIKQKLTNEITLYKDTFFNSRGGQPIDWAAYIKCYDGFLRAIFYFKDKTINDASRRDPPKVFVDFLKSIKCQGKSIRDRK